MRVGYDVRKFMLNEVKRMVCSWRLPFAVLAGLLLMLHALFDIYGTWDHYSAMVLLSFPLSLSDFTPFAALFCVIPYSDSYAEDFSNEVAFHISVRMGPRKYAFVRCICVSLAGAFVMTIIMSCTIAVCLLGAGAPETNDTILFLQGTVWWRSGFDIQLSSFPL